MKTKTLTVTVLMASLMIFSGSLYSQKINRIKTYLKSLPKNLKLEEKTPQKYLMTAEYFNKDIYGNFGSKVKVTGIYTRGLKDKYVRWNNAFISKANNHSGPYLDSVKQDYMEGITYNPLAQVLEESFFESFRKHEDNIYARNLIWDMTAIETFAWNYFDSLQLNQTYLVPEIQGAFDMADIGTYDHTKIELNWIGISMMNNKVCAVIEYKALDNKLELHTENMNSKGSEFYWGKTWISLENKQIEYAEMYSNTIQEMEIKGLPDKIMASTKRILKLERIK
jgi:hypothetical protein